MTYLISWTHRSYFFVQCYWLPIKTWACITDVEEDARDAKKYLLRREIRQQLGLIVGTQKQDSGSSSDENTDRKFFEKQTSFANIV